MKAPGVQGFDIRRSWQHAHRELTYLRDVVPEDVFVCLRGQFLFQRGVERHP